MSEREALLQIQEKYRRSSDAYYGQTRSEWGNGFHTALAECSLVAREGLDPEGAAEADDLSEFSCRASDQEWFERTGHCGHCGMIAHDCTCPDDDPCACGPHEPRTWPKPCWACGGSGVQDPLAKNRRTEEER